ncbi:GTPase Era [Corynebacterium cystitidis DSM 20524]|uniref:Dynamin family protein n=1 Tax=Corynebacterium cystitidis DSM 20524 TaxID=1121357 RepID=A0A1H9R5U9_9CORY|nr:GTPase Era [Corynebacterium cystitidis DSM 20524]SER68060.1 Dynamin family protein [Corynebacterium cystitidis DSM 20524]SNV86434.1 ABC transport system [Corynebacterium cystitidis]
MLLQPFPAAQTTALNLCKNGYVTSPTYSAVEALRDTMAATTLPTSPEAEAEARAIVAQLDDYILPRLANIDAPLLAVVGGSTGSGKSTLVNAIVGKQVTTAGVIRPTTRQPVLVANPADQEWFNSPHVLPGLAREQGAPAANAEATSLRVTTTDSLDQGLALLDAPDFDSIDDKNRALASQLLAAADLWVFVTTPARYADQLVWNFLNDAAGRNIEVIVILNRVDEDSMATVPDDLRRMMEQAGLGDATMFVVPYTIDFDIFLPDQPIAPIRDHLRHLAGDASARRAMAAKTVEGALRTLLGRVDAVVEQKADNEEFARHLSQAIEAHYQRATKHVIDATSDGKLLRTEVLQRWQDFVGTSDAFRTIERWYSMAVDRIGSFFSGQPAPVQEVETEIESGLHAVIVDAGDTAATRTWSHVGQVAPQLRAEADPKLSSSSDDLSDKAAQLVRDWQTALMEYIQDTAGEKRMRARVLSLGLNVVTVALMLVVFASTAGLTGGEIAIAGGSAVVGQKLLETIFGEETVRRMAKWARDDLDQRLAELYDVEQARYNEVLAPLVTGASSDELRQAAAEVCFDV